MIELKKLSEQEYDHLAGVYDGFRPAPQNSIAIVAQDQGELVGRIFLVEPTHIEGPWIRKDYRGGMLCKRLMDRVEQEAKQAGVKTLFAYATTDDIEDYLARLGYRPIPLTVWTKEVR